MARVLFGSILIPDDADEAYLASLGLSEKDIKEALQDSPYYDTGYKIHDPIMAIYKASQRANAEVPVTDQETDTPAKENENSTDISEVQYAADDVVYGYGGHIKTWKSVFKPAAKRRICNTIPLKQESDVTEWITFSLTPHTEDEIREKILTDYHNVCFSYICAHQKLSEDFIIELAALSTGLLHKFNYSENIDYLKHAVMISAGIEEGPYDFGMLPEGIKFTLANVETLTTDRLDWKAIGTNQSLSQEFKDKYRSLLYLGTRAGTKYQTELQQNVC